MLTTLASLLRWEDVALIMDGPVNIRHPSVMTHGSGRKSVFDELCLLLDDQQQPGKPLLLVVCTLQRKDVSSLLEWQPLGLRHR